MSYTKRIVCLANSMKVGGNCIAGREVLPDGRYGGWIRPISSRPSAEISFMEALCEDDLDPELLDILDIPLLEARPHNHQTENHLIDTSRPWSKQGRLAPDDVSKLCQHPTALWLNSDKTIHGSYDCLSQQEVATFTKSIVLIQVSSISVEVRTRMRNGDIRPSFRASFKYNSICHNLSITDPYAIHVFAYKGNGTYSIAGAHLTTSSRTSRSKRIMPDTLYTIGHSNHTIEHFLALLQQHGITAVCDVRSAPYSRYNPHFDREALKVSLKSRGIAYVFLGKELGARSEDPTCYLHGKIQYGKLAETALFQQGLQRVREGMERFRVALMCAEKEPLECHRTILVSRSLSAPAVPIEHIHADGHLEAHADALSRLAHTLGLRAEEQHLFRTHDDLIVDAYLMQEERIGYEAVAG